MNLEAATKKIRQALMAAFDSMEPLEYRQQLWAQVHATMERHHLVVCDVAIGPSLQRTDARHTPLTEPINSPPYEKHTDEVIFPFGKHAGTPISELPVSYLRWAAVNIKFRDKKVETAVVARVKALPPLPSEMNGKEVPY